MTSIQSTIRNILVEDARVNALIEDRVYDLLFPPGYQIPACTIQRISETLDPLTMTGTTTLQIDAYARTHEQAAEVAEAVRQTLTNTTQAGEPAILALIPQNTVDFYTVYNRLFRVSTDYAVTWRKQ